MSAANHPSMILPSRILLAEDNPADVRLVQEALAEHQVSSEIQVIDDGEKMFDFIDSLEEDASLPCPDLLLLDLHLPKHGGDEVLRYLRAAKRCVDTPVVIMSSSDLPRHREEAAANHVEHYFRKPSSLAQFLELGAIVKSIIYRERGIGV
jgi:CheY-like chemotaxis protein